MTEVIRKIGVYGGSFDPVHFGHLRPALEVVQQLNLDQLRFIPAGDPPHKERPRVSAADRIAMLEIAIADSPGLMVDKREIEQPSLSYTIDTLNSLHNDLADSELTLIIGTDQFNVFDTWHRWQELLQRVHVAVMQRPGEQLSDVAKGLLAGENAAGITLCQVTQLDISSTMIRHDLQQGTDIRFLVPYAVRQYIDDHQLYTGSAH